MTNQHEHDNLEDNTTSNSKVDHTNNSNVVIWKRQNFKELPRFQDSTSFLYLEHTIIEKNDRGIQFWHPDGMVNIPCANLGVLLLGPGTSLTHGAVEALASTGCSMLWIGEEGVRFYASGIGETRKSTRFLKQVRLWAHIPSRTRIARTIYQMRFGESLPESMTIEEIRGKEGRRMSSVYKNYCKAYNIKWTGRKYNKRNWDDGTPINRAISAGNACLHGLAHSAILSCGYSTALGFIHTGEQLSFVYDIADLYKTSIVLPIACTEVQKGTKDLEARVRHALRDEIRAKRLLKQMVDDIFRLFDAEGDDISDDLNDVGSLYDPDGDVKGGVNYGKDGRDDS